MVKLVVLYEIKVGALDGSIEPMEFPVTRKDARRQLNLGRWQEVFRRNGFRILRRENGGSYAMLRVHCERFPQA